MIQLIKKNNLFILGVMLQVTYFTQVYPYIHFHHTHNDNDLRIIVSSHPIDHDSENHPNQHSGEQHHNRNDHIVGDWNFTNPSSRQSLELPTILFFNNIITSEEVPEQVTIVQKEIKHPTLKQISLTPDLSRGPPNLS